jgi:thymidylate kinase
MIIAFEGVDRCGKTEISKELSRQLGLPVFKNTV